MATTNWTVPTPDDLEPYLTESILSALTTPSGTSGTDEESNKTTLLNNTVARVRATIQNAGRVPVSVTPGSVPPEGQQHVLILTLKVMAMSSGKPLEDFVSSDTFKEMFDEANDWLKDVRQGGSVTYPSDPVGEDGVTAEDDTTNPLAHAVRVGSSCPEEDLLTDPSDDNFNTQDLGQP